MASSSLPDAGARLELDLSAWNSNWDAAFSDVETLQGALDDLSGTSVDVEFNIDDTTLDDVAGLDGQVISPEIETTESEDTKKMVESLSFLALKEKIEWAWNIVGNVWDFASKIAEPIIGGFLDIDDAVARINAQTGGTGIEDLGDFIREIQAADLGESVDQIADVVIEAKQLDLPIKDATESALTFTHTWQDVDPTTVVGAWGTALQTGIVDTMQEASDLMTVFFQQGGNIGGDAIQVVQSNAQSWADMGLNMADALSLMNSLQSGTGATATEAAKMMQTFDDAFTAAANDPQSQQAKLLKMIGIDNPKEAGEAIGADTFNAFADAFSAQSSETQDLISGLFFGKGGKKFTGAIGEMTTEGGPFADVVGAAEKAASDIDDSLRGAIDDFVLAINTSIADLLASDKIDLDGFITRLKDGFQTAVGVLSNGGSIGDALEIGFNIQGLDTTVANLERIFGNVEIIILQVIMAIQRLQGMDTTDIGNTITDLAKGQLSFDLKIANEDEIPTLINQAMARGVSNSDIITSAKVAFDEAMASGDFDVAKSITNGLIASAQKNSGDTTVMAAFVQPWVDSLNTAMDDAMAGFSFGPQQKAGGTFGSDLFGSAAVGGAGGIFGSVQGALDGVIKSATDADTAASTATANIQTSWDTLNLNMATPVGGIVGQIDTANAAVDKFDINTASRLTGNTVTASFEEVAAVADEMFPIVIKWFKAVEMETFMWDIGVTSLIFKLGNLAAAVNNLPWDKLGKLDSYGQQLGGAGGGGGTTNNTTNHFNTTVNTQSNAQAAAAGYGIASSIRPGGG